MWKQQVFTEEDLKLIAVTRALAGTVKSAIDTPILSKDGDIACESENVYDQTTERLPDFDQAINEVRQIDYAVKPIRAKRVKNRDLKIGMTVLSAVRNVLAFVAGFALA